MTYSNMQEEFMKLNHYFSSLAEENPNFLKKEIFGFKGESKDDFKRLLKELKDAKESKNKYIKGLKLEEISKFLFKRTKLYEVEDRIRDSSNEIDLLLQKNDLGKIYGLIDKESLMPDVMKDNKTIICECKNLDTTVGVTWVGKFYSLLSQRKLKLGIIISYNGLAGKGEWDSSKGLVKKIYLKENIAILDIKYSDLEDIDKGKTIVDLIEEKYENLRFQTDISKYKKKHPAEK